MTNGSSPTNRHFGARLPTHQRTYPTSSTRTFLAALAAELSLVISLDESHASLLAAMHRREFLMDTLHEGGFEFDAAL